MAGAICLRPACSCTSSSQVSCLIRRQRILQTMPWSRLCRRGGRIRLTSCARSCRSCCSSIARSATSRASDVIAALPEQSRLEEAAARADLAALVRETAEALASASAIADAEKPGADGQSTNEQESAGPRQRPAVCRCRRGRGYGCRHCGDDWRNVLVWASRALAERASCTARTP